MNKLPVGKTILGAYGFTFGHLGTIIGLIWIPLVISTLLSVLPQIADNYGAAGSLAKGTGAIESLAISLLTLLLYAMVYVVVTRQALGLRQGTATYHFALGQPEFRMFGAVLLVGLIAMGPILVYVGCLAAAIAYAAGQGGGGPVELGVVLLACAGAFGVIYVIVRLSFLVAPVTVIENQINLIRGWALTRGNFWRIFAVMLAISAPIYLLETAGTLALMGSELAAALPVNGSHDPQAMQQQLTMLVGIIDHHAPSLMGMGLILAPFALGLSLSASAFAYRELAGTSVAA